MSTPASAPAREAEALLRVARGWQLAGRTRAAISAYRDLLAVRPGYSQGHVELARLLIAEGAVDEALAHLDAAEAAQGHRNPIHKLRVDALVARGGPCAALAHHRLEPGAGSTPSGLAEARVVCCLVVRNEEARLDAVLDHHRSLGVERFIVVDNASDDATPELLAARPDVAHWRTDESYLAANYGFTWMEAILRRHRPAGWCLFVDADELFVFPGDDRLGIVGLVELLEAEGSSALPAVMVDLYADRPVAETPLDRGVDPRAVCGWFDRRWYHEMVENDGPFANRTGFYGGARQRVFPKADSYELSKIPLLDYGSGRILTAGQHYTNGPAAAISTRRAALLHFKFVAALPSTARAEVERGEHYDAAVDYRHYSSGFAGRPDLCLYDPSESVRYTGPEQLLDIGVCAGEGWTP